MSISFSKYEALGNDFILKLGFLSLFLIILVVGFYYVREKNKAKHENSILRSNSRNVALIHSETSQSPTNSPNICINCNALVNHEDLFCQNCGTRLK